MNEISFKYFTMAIGNIIRLPHDSNLTYIRGKKELSCTNLELYKEPFSPPNHPKIIVFNVAKRKK